MKSRMFEVKYAIKYGINEAIFINCLEYWITFNRADQKNFHEGRTWSYNSKKAWSELLPFFTEKQIRAVLNNLIAHKVIRKGNFNKNPLNKTLWYAFEDEAEFVPSFAQNHKPIGPPGPMYSDKDNFSESEDKCMQEYIGPKRPIERPSRATRPILESERDIHNKILNTVSASKSPTVVKTNGAQVWEAYREAYQARYGTEPIRNAMTNSICSKLYERLGGKACQVIRFYLGHQDQWYVKKCHDLGSALKDAEALNTQMNTGKIITSGEARHKDQRQTSRNSYEEALRIYENSRGNNGKL